MADVFWKYGCNAGRAVEADSRGFDISEHVLLGPLQDPDLDFRHEFHRAAPLVSRNRPNDDRVAYRIDRGFPADRLGSRRPSRYQVVLDCIGDRSLSAYRRVMNPRGVYVGVGGDGGTVKMLLDLLKVRVVSPFVSQRFVSFIASLNGTDLGALAELIERGKVTPVIDRSYPLERAADAVRYVETRHARGKVVLTIR